METAYIQSARIFKAFCDENRLRILEALQSGDQCACVLMEKLGIKQSALSYHMKILVESGVVESRAVGKWTHYRISEVGCERAKAQLRQITELCPNADGCSDCAV